jgi:hypothetical protein
MAKVREETNEMEVKKQKQDLNETEIFNYKQSQQTIC